MTMHNYVHELIAEPAVEMAMYKEHLDSYICR